jgi:hypothetical protein
MTDDANIIKLSTAAVIPHLDKLECLSLSATATLG